MKKGISLSVITIVLGVLVGNVMGQNLPDQFQRIFGSKKSNPINKIVSHSGPLKVNQGAVTKYQLDSLILVPASDLSGMENRKMECKYDGLGRITMQSASNYNKSTGNMDFSYKYIYKYGENYCIKDHYEKYSSNLYFRREKTVYDADGRIQYFKEGSDSVDFENTAIRTDYTYANNLLSNTTEYSSNSNNPNKIIQYYYDSLNRDTAEVTLAYDYLTVMLEKYKKIISSYDVNGDMKVQNVFTYNSNTWTQSGKSDFLYNSNHNCTSYIVSDLESNSVDSAKYISTYNESILNKDIYCGDIFVDFPYNFQSQLNKIDLYMKSGDSFVLVGTFNLYYSQKNTGTDVPKLTSSNQIRYNSEMKRIEFQDGFSISNQIINIYSTNGTLVLSKGVNLQGYVETANLSQGVYIYKILSDTKVYNGKIIVR